MKLTHANIRKLSKEEIVTRLAEEIRYEEYVEEIRYWLEEYEYIADKERNPKAFGLYLAYSIHSIREEAGRKTPYWDFCDKVQEFMDFEYFDEILDLQWEILNHPLYIGNKQDIDYTDEKEVFANALHYACDLVDWSVNYEDGIAWLRRELKIGDLLLEKGITDHCIGEHIDFYL